MRPARVASCCDVASAAEPPWWNGSASFIFFTLLSGIPAATAARGAPRPGLCMAFLLFPAQRQWEKRKQRKRAQARVAAAAPAASRMRAFEIGSYRVGLCDIFKSEGEALFAGGLFVFFAVDCQFVYHISFACLYFEFLRRALLYRYFA